MGNRRRGKVQGHVEKPCSNRNEGTIRLVVDGAEDDSQGALVKYTTNDYVPPLRGARNAPNRLAKGDWVEFTLIQDRRTKHEFARKIQLIQSEKERLRQEEEKRMLAEATEEHGVITALKGEYGFLRSNKRREEVYFHYSSIELEDAEDEHGNKTKSDEDLVLKEGQDMKFLVVTEGGSDDKPKRRISARQVKMQPRGSVKFHDVLATGVTGVVSLVPQPQDRHRSLQ